HSRFALLVHLVDVVEVSPVLDGGSSSSFSSADGCNERGLIRPLPPLIELGVWDLPFGLCVDAFYEEARWEGVIFDHCNGMEERSIFFPDLGDELKIGIDQLRITQDWNEATENWEPRRKWMFLEVIEECEQFSYIAVSFKQIWYDLRNSNEFDKIRDWTCNVKDLWRDLVREIVGDYFTLTLEEVYKVLDFSGAFLKETPELESVEHTDIVHCDSSPSNVLGSKIGISDCPMESGDSTNLLDTDQNGGGIVFIQEKYDTNPLVDGASEKEIVLVEEPESQKEISCYDAGEVISDSSYNERSEKRRRPTSIYWQPLVLSEVEFCPDVINQYGAGCESKMTREGLKTKARKHLAYLGWRIEWTQHKNCPGQRRYRYMSPNKQDKKVYYSIPQVCSHLKKESNMNFVLSQNDQSRMHSTVDNNLSNLDVHHPIGASSPVEVVAESHTPDGLPIGNTNHKRTTKSKACPPKHKRNGLPTRVQNVNSPCLSHQNVLSWLIDSNMVLPRSKVYYRGKGGKNTHDIEGGVTLDGIKCSCCQNVYRPGGFAIHASGCYDCKPCASIFLRDELGCCDVGGTKIDLLAESYSKLNAALSVMHECFEPLKNPYSNKDLMDDVIFGRRSELNRSNFQGFYVVIMERNEELVSVATVRIFGRKVAEVPLVATRFMYRGLGMCRILMDELEKNLMRLGVERIVLPVVPNMLETWTKSFKFVKMTSFERSQFLDYAFLDFPGTVMCQKLLTTLPSQI
ncbi:uncharacterized protein LOC133285188, partial [Gastrolobium bilobum]|uniref:uncharacterized protein LOC133285188 n=1 Tax=Gastrolobium bilobum TaxID=150636 RepID=UPI002AB10277